MSRPLDHDLVLGDRLRKRISLDFLGRDGDARPGEEHLHDRHEDGRDEREQAAATDAPTTTRDQW
jgi:hypothetical protein